MPTEHQPPLRVLHVEDDVSDSELIRYRLRREEICVDVVLAESEQEVRRALASSDFDVILSDFTLPQFDGMAALKLARELRPDVPFIFVSGTIGEERAVESLRAGAWDYVLKDRLDRLGPAIRNAVQTARHEATHMRAIAALRESEERFRQVTETIEEVFWLVDIEPRKFVYVSPAYERIWGRPCDQLYAAPGSWVESVHPADRQRVEEAAARRAIGRFDLEFRIVRPDGSVRWINGRAFPIQDAAGQVYRLAGIAQDVTAQRNLESEICQANKMEALGLFAGGIAHDFNNVLAVIQMQTHLLLGEAGLRPGVRQGLDNVLAAAARATNLTRQLLTFSRREITEAQEIDLVEVTNGMAKLLRRIVGEHIEFETRFAAGLPGVHADPTMIEQVLMNLVLNARDAMPQGGRLVVTIDIEDAGAVRVAPHVGVQPGRFLCLLVMDTGCGIPAEHRSRIFEPFFTTKQPGIGTGLGLATVCRIATQHHGWIEVQSEVNRGTTFRVYFPALAHPARQVEAKPTALPHGRGENILLVEDDESLRKMARVVLERFGYRIAEAATAAAAMQRWREHGGKFDLLITDVVLPAGDSGGDLARRLISEKPTLRVIYTSGHSPDTMTHHLPAGIKDTVLPKPFSTDALVSMVRRQIDRASDPAN